MEPAPPCGDEELKMQLLHNTEPDSSQNYDRISFSSSVAPPPADQSV